MAHPFYATSLPARPAGASRNRPRGAHQLQHRHRPLHERQSPMPPAAASALAAIPERTRAVIYSVADEHTVSPAGAAVLAERLAVHVARRLANRARPRTRARAAQRPTRCLWCGRSLPPPTGRRGRPRVYCPLTVCAVEAKRDRDAARQRHDRAAALLDPDTRMPSDVAVDRDPVAAAELLPLDSAPPYEVVNVAVAEMRAERERYWPPHSRD